MTLRMEHSGPGVLPWRAPAAGSSRCPPAPSCWRPQPAETIGVVGETHRLSRTRMRWEFSF